MAVKHKHSVILNNAKSLTMPSTGEIAIFCKDTYLTAATMLLCVADYIKAHRPEETVTLDLAELLENSDETSISYLPIVIDDEVCTKAVHAEAGTVLTEKLHTLPGNYEDWITYALESTMVSIKLDAGPNITLRGDCMLVRGETYNLGKYRFVAMEDFLLSELSPHTWGADGKSQAIEVFSKDDRIAVIHHGHLIEDKPTYARMAPNNTHALLYVK